MADSILRLRVDSQEYDQKLKRAADGIKKYADGCKQAGGTLEHLDDGVLDFVKALGRMDTVATGTKQKLREMSNALTTLTETYRGLTDEEKASPFGQELANGIQLLTERAGQAQDAMADVAASIRNAASDTRVFDQVASGVTMLTSTMQTAQGAAKLLGIELGDNVEVLAKLQAAMAVTQGLQQMQNLLQKQSALMQGINALQKEFNLLAKANPYVLLASSVAAVAGAYLLWSKNGDKAKKTQESLNYELENTQNQLSQIDKDTDFSVGIAQAAGKSEKAILGVQIAAARAKLELADLNFDNLFANGASTEQLNEAQRMQQEAWDNLNKLLWKRTEFDVKAKRGGGGGGGRSSSSSSSSAPATGLIGKKEAELQNLRTQWNGAETEQDIARIAIQIQAVESELERLKNIGKDKFVELGDTIVTGTLPPLMKLNSVLQELNSKLDKAKTPEEYQNILSDIKAVEEEIDRFKGKNLEVTANKSAQSFSKAASAISSVGSALQGIEDPGAKIMGIIAEAVANIALAFSKADVKEGASGNVWYWIAATAAGLTTMVSTIAAIKSATSGYAQGGIVKGNSYSGDNMMAQGPGGELVGLNAGEVVLTRAMASNLANSLQSPMSMMRIVGEVQGERIVLVANRFLKRSGQGEIVTW